MRYCVRVDRDFNWFSLPAVSFWYKSAEKLPMSFQMQLSSRAPRSLDLSFFFFFGFLYSTYLPFLYEAREYCANFFSSIAHRVNIFHSWAWTMFRTSWMTYDVAPHSTRPSVACWWWSSARMRRSLNALWCLWQVIGSYHIHIILYSDPRNLRPLTMVKAFCNSAWLHVCLRSSWNRNLYVIRLCRNYVWT